MTALFEIPKSEEQKPEPKIKPVTVQGYEFHCGKLKMSQLAELVYDQSGTSLEVVDRAWRAVEESLKLGGRYEVPIDTLKREFDADDFRELYLFVLRHSKAYLTA